MLIDSLENIKIDVLTKGLLAAADGKVYIYLYILLLLLFILKIYINIYLYYKN